MKSLAALDELEISVVSIQSEMRHQVPLETSSAAAPREPSSF